MEKKRWTSSWMMNAISLGRNGACVESIKSATPTISPILHVLEINVLVRTPQNGNKSNLFEITGLRIKIRIRDHSFTK
jgi:hypothetical protein